VHSFWPDLSQIFGKWLFCAVNACQLVNFQKCCVSQPATLFTATIQVNLQWFDAVGWVAGRASGLKKKQSGGVLGHGYLSGARCRLSCGPADATASDCLLLQ